MSETITIEQMNEAIALFDGYERYEDNYGIWFKREGLIKCLHPKLQDLKYHSSWDWLMPVVEKISKIPLLNTDDTPCTDPQDVCYPRTFGMPTEDGKNVMVRFNAAICCEAPTLLEAAYKAVYDFIKFENG